jgi:hypothetical protein
MSITPIEAAISGEDACIYAYGVIGSQVRGAATERARKALADHRAWRDRLQSQAPVIVAASIAYDFPFPVEDAASAKLLARTWVIFFPVKSALPSLRPQPSTPHSPQGGHTTL